MASDVKLLVRERELGCRNSWGDDLFMPQASSHTTTPVSQRGLTVQASKTGDQVTSVSTSDGLPTLPAADDVVTHTAVRPDGGARSSYKHPALDHNAGAIADQDERAREMARGANVAVASARLRHAKRRSAPRPMIEPDPSPTTVQDSDRVIDAVDRASYTPVPSPLETPPVPRDEVLARGQQVSPAVGADARFDSVPTFNPNVDLPRLRKFFNNERVAEPETSRGEHSSYDLALERAKEFKAAEQAHGAGVSRRSNISAPPSPPPLSQTNTASMAEQLAPSVVAPQHGNADEHAVVWDVDSSSLNVAFERARSVISGASLPDLELDPDDDNDGILATAHSGTSDLLDPDARPYPVEQTWLDDSDDHQPDFNEPAADPISHDDERQWIDGSATQIIQALSFDDEEEETFEQLPVAPPRVEESPRSSWWRSLNFGRKRRYQPAPEPVYEATGYGDEDEPYSDAYDDEDSGYADAYAAEAQVEPAPVRAVAHEIVDAGYDADLEDDELWLDDDFEADERDYAAESTLIREGVSITTEDSWVADEWVFPDPQPARWHEERARLLASRPDSQPLPAPVTFRTQRQVEPIEPVLEEQPRPSRRREPDAYYAIDEPGGLSALRAALFSDEDLGNDTGNRPAVRVTRSRQASRESGQPSMARSAAEQEDEPMLVESPRPRASSRTPAPIRFAQHKSMFDETFDIGDATAEDDGNPHEYELASRVSKACWTCRSFRAADEGRSGWCMNEWAPTHRQMVDAEEIACHSSIGDWWIAADTTWIPPVDRIVPETPRTDRLAARSQVEDVGEARERRRVRTRKVV